MEGVHSQNDAVLIEENASYVLGMYDLYQNDTEIISMLKMKGLNDGVVQKVLQRIKRPAYEKRVKQAKIMIAIGVLLLFILVVAPFLIVYFTTSQETVLLTKNVYSAKDMEEGSVILFSRFLLKASIYVVVVGFIQLITGTVNFVKYKRLLSKM